MLLSFAASKRESNKPFMSIQNHFTVTRVTHTEKSNVAYLEVMDAIADSKDTIMHMLHELHQQFIIGGNMSWLVVEGDAKVYDILQSLKFEYGEAFKWMIPYPGDWHMLMNFQHVLMKAYYDAGLKSLAKASGYPLNAIQSCGQFKRTHYFLLEAWEALYRVMLTKFFDHCDAEKQLQQPLLASIDDSIFSIIPPHSQVEFIRTFREKLDSITISLQGCFLKFKTFLQKQARTDDTWRFWIQFVFQDAMAYVGLFLGMRSGDWSLRMASMKQMAPLYTAFDHATYQKLIGRHIADILCMPPPVLTMFQQGAFVVSVTGREWHSVGIDECHEMGINRACKTAIVRPNPDYINRIAKYIPYRTKSLENLKYQLFPEDKLQGQSCIMSPFSTARCDYKREQNIQAQLEVITTKLLLAVTDSNRGLVNPFTGKTASPEQTHDLLNFRYIGQREFLLGVQFNILKTPSVQAPNRKKRLQTFSEKRCTKQRITQLEKDRRLIVQCMRRKMRWSKRTGRPIEKPGEQLLQFPMALADHQGNPRKGQKSYMTKALQTRYKSSNPPVVTTLLPSGWKPQCSILEGMFLINTTPLGTHTTFKDYAQFLMQRFIITQFRKGSSEVHVIFDNPGRLENTPKFFEQKRRDSVATVTEGHVCELFKRDTKLKGKWRENVLNCRQCKRNLVIFLGHYLLHNIGANLLPNQKCYVAGAFDDSATDSAWFVQGQQSPQPDPSFTCNAEETDTRIWLHVKQTSATRVLIVSPDTDVYHIGLPLQARSAQPKDVIVQISAINSREIRLLHLNHLVLALQNDPDLATINPRVLPQVLQTLYVTSGCDYISFFSGIGKATFLQYFFQHAAFISGDQQPEGTLENVSLDDDLFKQGFLAFVRLIGTIYFKKHATGFDTPSSVTHFRKFSDQNSLQQHTAWLEDIRQNIWDRISFESDMIPSIDALWRHWSRTCWVLHMWHQADQNTMRLEPIAEYGWTIEGSTLAIDWDSSSNVEAIKQRVMVLTRGCKYKTGCSTARCGCKKKAMQCLEGCLCINCTNLPTSASTDTEIAQVIQQETEETDIDSELDGDTDELIDWVFGEDDTTSNPSSDEAEDI